MPDQWLISGSKIPFRKETGSERKGKGKDILTWV